MDTITIPSYNSSTGAGTLSSIASEHGVSINDILSANKGNTAAIPDPTNPNIIKAGATLNIPKPSVIQTTTAQRAETQANVQKLNTIQTQITPTGANVTGNTDTSNPSGGVGGNTPSIDTNTGEIKDANGNVIGKTTESMKKDESAKAGDPLSDIKTQIEGIKSLGQTQINNMKSTLDQLSASSDAKTQGVIAQIKSMYADRIAAVHESYKRLGAAKDMNDFRNGVNRYTPAQGQGVLTDNEVQEQTKITEFMTKMFDSITRAQNAQDSNDTKTLNLEMTKVAAIQKDINTSIANLYKSALTYQKDLAKQTADAQKQKHTDMKNGMDTSKRIAPALASEMAGMSATNRKKFIEKYAKDNNLDPAILTGDVQAYMDTQANKNKSKSTTPAGSKTKPLVSGKLSYTNDDLGQIEEAFSKGANVNGTQYNQRGTDGYVDPGLYKAMADKWTAAGGIVKDFTAKFPPSKYINPASNSTLPTYLQNLTKVKTTGGGFN